MSERFCRGQEIVWRSRPQGQVGYAIPFVVIEDGPEFTALLQRNGSICMKRTGTRRPGGRLMLPGGADGGHAEVRWEPGHDVVRVHAWGTHHSAIRAWNVEAQRFEGWYVNLESDWIRMPIGFDSLDLILDVVVDDDLEEERLKDEDELAWAEKNGLVSPQLADLARTEADRVRQSIADRRGIFGEDWSRWRPDPSWPLPQLPPDWKST